MPLKRAELLHVALVHFSHPRNKGDSPVCPGENGWLDSGDASAKGSSKRLPLWESVARDSTDLVVTGPEIQGRILLMKFVDNCGYSNLKFSISGYNRRIP